MPSLEEEIRLKGVQAGRALSNAVSGTASQIGQQGLVNLSARGFNDARKFAIEKVATPVIESGANLLGGASDAIEKVAFGTEAFNKKPPALGANVQVNKPGRDVNSIADKQVSQSKQQTQVTPVAGQTSTTGQANPQFAPVLGGGQRFDANVVREGNGLEVNFGGVEKGQQGGFISSDSLTPEKAARIQETLRTGRQAPNAGSTNDNLRNAIAERVTQIGAAARSGAITVDQAQAMVADAKGKFNEINSQEAAQQQAQQQGQVQQQFTTEQAALAKSGDTKGLLASFSRQGRKGAIEALGKTVNSKTKAKKPFFTGEKLLEKLPAGTSKEVRNFFLQSGLDEAKVDQLRDIGIKDPDRLNQIAIENNVPFDTFLTVLDLGQG